MKFRFGKCVLVLLMLCATFSVSCGHNLLVNLNEDKTANIGADADKVTTDEGATSVIDAIDNLLDDATTTSEYTNLRDAANSIINNPKVSDSIKEDAKKVKGESGLGVLDITPLDLVADVLSATSTSNEDLTPADFIDSLGISDSVTTQNIRDLANAFNDVPDSKMTSSNFTSKAVANTVVIIKSVDAVYDVDKNEFKGTSKESLSKLVSSDSDGNSLVSYATEAVDAYSKSGMLDVDDSTADVKTGIDDFKAATVLMEKLNTAVNTESSFENNDVIYNFRTKTITTNHVTGAAQNDNALIDAAFVDILAGGNE